MILKQQRGIFYLQFPGLLKIDGLVHAVFMREGGVSSGAFHSLNISHGVGDDAGNVAGNRAAMQSVLGEGRMAFARQNHGEHVCAVEDDDFIVGGITVDGPPQADAMMTPDRNRFLVIQVADCQAVMIADPVKKVVANIHSGWRGSIQNIIGRTVSGMRDRYGCDPGDMMAGVGPSLGPCCGEFIHYKTEIPSEYWTYRIDETHFDFWRISRDQLAQAGVPPARVEGSRICTRCNSHLFYSYRAGHETGRFGAAIGFKS